MNEFLRKGNKAWHLLVTKLWLRPRFGSIGSRTIVIKPRQLFNARHVRIGNRCLIEEGATFYAVTHYAGVRFTPEITIGDRAYINYGLNITAARRVTIADDVMLAFNVSIFDFNHGFRDSGMPVKEQPIVPYARGVEICEGAWIGANSFICGNVRIGRGAVVGANSVVKQDVPDFSVVGGNPARILRAMDPKTGSWEKVK